MKSNISILLLVLTVLMSCTSSTNSPEFMEKATGDYLFNSDEKVTVYFEEAELYMSWRGAERIKPMRLNEDTFFVKEMNKKIQFLNHPRDGKAYIGVLSKEKKDSISYDYRKLAANEKIPSEYIEDKQFDKAMTAYLELKEKDSLDVALNRRNLNRWGYRKLYDDKDTESAIAIFKINTALHPDSYNVWDSLAEAYLKKGDTILALENYKKSLVLDSGNSRLKRTIKELEGKKLDD